MSGKLSDCLSILKLHLCLYLGCSAVFGYAQAGGRFEPGALMIGASVVLLTCGAAVLNNIQDKDYDRLFARTRRRALAQNRLPVKWASFLSAVLMLTGLAGLYLICGPGCTLLGILGALAYNLVYTPLKKVSLLAVFPGSLCGMIPPLIGWYAAGRPLFEAEAFLIMTIFGVWQIPHFLIISLQYSDKKTGQKDIPTFFSLFSKEEIRLQIMIWTSLYSMAIILYVLTRSKEGMFDTAAIINAATFLIASAILVHIKNGMKPMFFAGKLSILMLMGAGILTGV